MGMFDTVHVKTPLICPKCGSKIPSLQTKELSDSMSLFKIGSLLNDSPVLTGILQETLWCSECSQAPPREVLPFFCDWLLPTRPF